MPIRVAGGRWWSWLVFWACLLCSALPGGADEPPAAGPEVEAAKKFQGYAKETAAAYDARADHQDGRKLTLRGEPILRWSNPLGGRKAHGEVFLWTDQGRPAAVLSMYEYTAPDGAVHEHHEFCSLARTGLHFASPRPLVWTPAEAGIDLKPLADAPAPAASPRQRLTQMRDLAAKFTAEKTTRENETRVLRLLSQPVYRYEGLDAKDGNTLDGALFAFVEATDPEIFLLVEARTNADKPVWHYAAARMNSVRLEVSHRDAPVWKVDVLPWRDALNRRDLPYTAFQVK
jgi:hypothetical protein